MATSDRTKADDGCVSTGQAARIAGTSRTRVIAWGAAGLVTPTRAGGGRGTHNRYDVRDVTALAAIAELRRRGVSMQAVRKVQALLREEGIESFAACRLAAVDRGRGQVDVALIRGARERNALALSLLEAPGQTLIAEVALGDLERTTRRAFAKIQAEPPAIRGRRPKSRRAA